MKVLFFTALLFLAFSNPALAQSAGRICGQVVKDAKGIEGSTISLLRAKDSTALKLSASDKEGRFAFEGIADGKYLISVTTIAHKKSFSNHIEISYAAPTVNLPAIILVPEPKAMAGVTVTTIRPLIEQKIDRTIVNVDASVTNAGSSALEILEKSPGVTVDRDGNISLKGKEGVMIMIDGRLTQLGGTDLANLLRNMNSNQLDQIEIMTNPPARYDAAGNAGIINIKTKKTATGGYNGSAALGYVQGRYPKANEGFNFNYREGKMNVFTNLSHNYRKTFETLTIQRNLRNDNNNQLENYFDQGGNRIAEGNSYNGKVGLDYFATKKTTVGVVFNGISNAQNVNNLNRTNISTASKELESITRATVNDARIFKSFSTNLNFRKAIDAKGKEFTSDFDYLSYASKVDQFMENAYFSPNGNSLKKSDTLLGSLPQHIKVHSGRMDYIHPYNKTSKFEAGVKSSIVRTDNDANYDSIQFGRIVHDYNRSNHFIYQENINAAYVNLSTSLSKKISAQFGLRLENTNAKGTQLTTAQRFNRNYTSLFPTMFLQYKANEKNNFGVNYGRRIRRPDYESLNPFIRFIDRYTYSRGNPNLKPQFSNNIEISHTYKNYITTALNYTATNDIIQSVIEQKGQEAYQTIQNIASLRQFGLSVNANKQMNKWWTNNINLNVFNNNYKGVVNKAAIDFTATSYLINATQQFKLNKTLTAELSGRYRNSQLMGVLRAKPVGFMAIGFSQQVMKNKGAIRLTVRDVFYTQRMRAIVNYGNVDATFQEAGDSRVLALSFSYRFTKGKNVAARKRTGSVGEEQERIGVE